MNEITSFKTLIGSLYKKLNRASSYGTLDFKTLLLVDIINEFIYDCPSCYSNATLNKLKNLLIYFENTDKDICKYREQRSIYTNLVGCKDCNPNNSNLIVVNTPPIVDNVILENIDLEIAQPFYFTRSMFTKDYFDRESDLAKDVMITVLPLYGTLYYDNEPVTLNFVFNISNVGNLTYQRNTEDPITEIITFKISDNNFNTLFSVNTNITLFYNEILNLPPDSVGDNNKVIAHDEIITFTKEDFTTSTNPTYHDPELDEPYALKILSLPISGTLTYNNIPVSITQEILLATLETQLLKYYPLSTIRDEYIVTFNYAISDIGSMQYSE